MTKRAYRKGRPLLFSHAVSSKLAESAINPDLLLHYCPIYGHTAGRANLFPQCLFSVAFRLTEPEAETDTEWLLETVIIGERGTHWTPAARKVNAPAADALPAKWKPYAEEIVKKQSEMTSFLGSIESCFKRKLFVHTDV